MEKNKLMMIIVIVLLVVLLGVLGVVAYRVMTMSSSISEEPAQETEEVSVTQSDIKIFTVSDSIYTNLLVGEDNKEHVARLSISLGVNTSDGEGATFLTTLNEKTVVVKDIVIGLLRKKTYEELKKEDAQEVLKSEIADKLRKEFDNNFIETVYISDLFLQ